MTERSLTRSAMPRHEISSRRDDSGSGHIESPDAPVEPASLFIRQRVDRIGEAQASLVLK